ncbi:uncharacterized protein LOC124165003 [Ischnura elegans]|uniref:uncharacterized protein LOC124165003 n=1 Tax=Ischnura elegans TaxID=197161 RepID=UPI001ED8B974|nr:uncharacterized protein LOC124165003 [Ischnura elegans]
MWKVTVNINGTELGMEIDTGSAISAVSEDCYKRHFLNSPLEYTDVKLRTYSSECIRPLGIIQVHVQFQGAPYKLPYFVVRNGGPPILGRDWLKTFKFSFQMLHLGAERSVATLEGILRKFPSLWDDGLGTFSKGKVSLSLKEGTRPVYRAPRALAFALKNRVDKELDSLLRKESDFVWTRECDRAFESVKASIVSGRDLAHYSPSLPVILECDASPFGLGAVLVHRFANGQERPIAFASRSLSRAERNYSQIDREALAIMFGVQKFNQYIYGRNFILRTDHKPLLYIFGEKKGIPQMAANRLQRWAIILQGYDFQIRYIRAADNKVVDGLSRLPLQREEADVKDFSYIELGEREFLPVKAKDIHQETQRDPLLRKVLDFCMFGWPTKPDVEFKPFMHRKNELTVEQGCILWGNRVIIPDKLRSLVLRELHAGHQGIVKMKSLARSYVWWPKLDESLESLLVDSSTKWPEVVQLKNGGTGEIVNHLQGLFSTFGLPEQIVSDNGSPFTSGEFQQFWVPLHIALPQYLFNCRISPHSVTGESPSKLMFGRTLWSRLTLLNLSSTVALKQSFQKESGDGLRIFQVGYWESKGLSSNKHAGVGGSEMSSAHARESVDS